MCIIYAYEQKCLTQTNVKDLKEVFIIYMRLVKKLIFVCLFFKKNPQKNIMAA